MQRSKDEDLPPLRLPVSAAAVDPRSMLAIHARDPGQIRDIRDRLALQDA
jgi:hypothetical protein